MNGRLALRKEKGCSPLMLVIRTGAPTRGGFNELDWYLEQKKIRWQCGPVHPY